MTATANKTAERTIAWNGEKIEVSENGVVIAICSHNSMRLAEAIRDQHTREMSEDLARQVRRAIRRHSDHKEIVARLARKEKPVRELYLGLVGGSGSMEYGLAVWADGFECEWTWSGDARDGYVYRPL